MKQPRFLRAGAAVVALMLLFVGAVLVIASLLDHARREERLSQAQAQAQHFASGAEASVNRCLLGIDVLLAGVDNLLDLATQPSTGVNLSLANRLIQNAVRQNLLVTRLTLVDAHGLVVATSERNNPPVRLTLPATFLDDALNPSTGALVISAPVVSFQSSEQVLYMGRALRMASGMRLVAVAEVPVPQLARILVQGADIDGLQATLERGNGELLLYTGSANKLVVQERLTPALNSRTDWDQHAAALQARLSPEPAILAVRKTLYHDIYITAGIPIPAALRPWGREVNFIHSVAAVMVGLIVAASTLAFWYLLRLQRAQASIAHGKAVLDHALASMVSGFVLLDAEHTVLTWNPRFIELHPWLRDAIEPHIPFRTLVDITSHYTLPMATESQRLRWAEQRMALLRQFEVARQVTAANGAMLEITERQTPDGGVVILYQDVTRLRQAIADVEQLAFYDPLTGLPNRRLLNDRLHQGIAASLRSTHLGALLFLDLDHFKTLNDTAGHERGDQLLQHVAQRLKASVREEDTVARLGGDEFVVMLQNLSSDPQEAQAQVRTVAETILQRMNMPFQLPQGAHTSTCSMGATLFGHAPQQASELLKQADIAMYQVKSTGRNGLCFFDPHMLTDITARADMERDLRRAIDNDQFILYYQIQVRSDGQPVGAEVLLRWQHPQQGLIAPGQFIGLAEETGLIMSIGEWVLRAACQQLKTWATHPFLARLPLAVNVSARQFHSPNLVHTIQTILLETGVQADLLKLELTESIVLDNIDDTIEKMQQLKNLGVHFSLDDFGTGYSSLAYLTRLPLDQLKIDRSFVCNIGLQASDAAVIHTIIGLADNLNLEVIAEGVETVAQCAFLASHGCSRCQGYLFGYPLPVHEFESLVGKAVATAALA